MVSVYMPTDYGDNESLEKYIDVCACISAMFEESEATQLLIAGDFNCQPGSRFFNIFESFANDHNLCLTDLDKLNDAFTYCNDAGTATSWIDHVLCSQFINCQISTCLVRYDIVCSDHRPLVVVLDKLLPVGTVSDDETVEAHTRDNVPDWTKADNDCVARYQYELDQALSNINIPIDVFRGNAQTGTEVDEACIDAYYNAVKSCILEASYKCIPPRL